MLKALTTIVWITFLFGSLGAQAEELRLDVSFEEPSYRQSPFGDLWTVPGCDLRGEPGAPILPARSFTFVIPYGHEASHVRLERIVSEPLAGAWNLAPAQRPQPLSRLQSVLPTEADLAIYQSPHSYPEAWAQLQPEQIKHGYTLASVTVRPLSYQPARGRLTRLVSASLILTTRPGARGAERFRALPADRKAVLARAEMSSAISSYPHSPVRGPARLDPGDYDYLIIAPDAFMGLGGEDSLESLRDLRESLGLASHLVSLEWVLANYTGLRPDGGQDDATKVRQFLADAYSEWTVDYVLLVGDADAGDVGGESGDQIFPVRKLFVNVGYPDVAPDHLPSDLYFSCLDGSFDEDGDGAYGEPGDGLANSYVDMMAELFVGRAPVDSEQELRRFVAKTMAYESGAGAWLQQVLMVGELLWDDPAEVWGGDAMDEIVNGSADGGFTTVGFAGFTFFQAQSLYDREMPVGTNWLAGDLIPLLDDSPHIVNHLGHSDVTYNMRLLNHHVDDLLNPHPFLHYSQGCYNGAFDNRSVLDYGGHVVSQDSIAEHLVTAERAAFATVSNSRYGWGSIMTDGPSQRFHRQFWDAFFGEGMSTIGQALVDSKEDNADAISDPFIRWVAFENNLLGDPAVALKKSLNTSDPLLGAYPPHLRFISRMGDPAPEPQSLAVRNDGLAELSFSAQCLQDWLTFTPDSGDAPGDIQVSVDPTGLSAGVHTAQLTLSSSQAANSPLEVSVEYNLVEIPRIQVPHGAGPLLDGVIEPGEYDDGLTLPIGPDGSADVTAHLVVADGKLHLAVDDRVDTSNTDFDRLELFFDRDGDGLWPTSPGGTDGVYWLLAMDGGRLLFLPVFNDGSGTAYDFRNRESDPTGFEAVIGFQDNHRVYEIALDMETSHIDVGDTGSFSMFLDVQDSEQWGTGAATGYWPPHVPELDDQNYFGVVDLVPSEPWLACQPSVARFEAVHNRASPEPLLVSVLELLGSQVSFTAESAESWIAFEPALGTTPGELSVAVDSSSMDIGQYQGTISIAASGPGNSPLGLPVQLTVLPEPAMMVCEPDAFNLIHIEGDPNPSPALVVRNTGELPMSVVLSPSESWLGGSPVMFSVEAQSEQEIQLNVYASSLDLGEYAASLRFQSDEAEGGQVMVPLWLTVRGPNSPPPVPQLLSPADGARVSAGLSLTCQPVVDPEGDEVSYTFTLFDGGGAELESSAGHISGDEVLWQPTQAPANGRYSWQVEAFDALGASSGPTDPSTFKVSGPDTGCGCASNSAADGDLIFWAVFVLFGLMVRVRRFFCSGSFWRIP